MRRLGERAWARAALARDAAQHSAVLQPGRPAPAALLQAHARALQQPVWVPPKQARSRPRMRELQPQPLRQV